MLSNKKERSGRDFPLLYEQKLLGERAEGRGVGKFQIQQTFSIQLLKLEFVTQIYNTQKKIF